MAPFLFFSMLIGVVRWLWIDSLCIIQDSPDDWRREARTMCDVYQNAFLNISADHAVDARGGCFCDRYFGTVDAFKLQMKPLQSTWWVSVDERNLFEWVKTAPSSARAWIYQERHFFPRSRVLSAILALGAGRIRMLLAYGSHSLRALCFGMYPKRTTRGSSASYRVRYAVVVVVTVHRLCGTFQNGKLVLHSRRGHNPGRLSTQNGRSVWRNDKGLLSRLRLHVPYYLGYEANDQRSGGDAYRDLLQLDSSANYRHLYVDGQLDQDIGYGTNEFQQFGELPDWFHGFAPVEYYCLFLAVFRRKALGMTFYCGAYCSSPQERKTLSDVRTSITEKEEAWEQLWRLVAPYWGEVEQDVETARKPTGPVPVNIQKEGPWALYEFDGDVADDAGFLKLEPKLVTLI
ncbi:MAG: hypothetical protein Q9171_005089 [Xanthocarpia ochracea]